MEYANGPSPSGITIRQYFVAQAMAGLAHLNGAIDGAWKSETIAKYAVEIADACLAREEETRIIPPPKAPLNIPNIRRVDGK